METAELIKWEVYSNYDNNGDTKIIGTVETEMENLGVAIEYAWVKYGRMNVGFVKPI
jgi:hypothetical protein